MTKLPLDFFRKSKREKKTDSHPLKDFFAIRKIPVRKLAEALEVPSMTIWRWLDGKTSIPKEKNKILFSWVKMIQDWEKDNDQIFND